MSILGNYFAIYKDGQRIALATSVGAALKKQFEDTTTADSNGWTEVTPVGKSITGDIEAIYCSAIGNLLQFPEDVSQASAWDQTNITVSATKIANPDGRLLAQTVSIAALLAFTQTISLSAVSDKRTISVWLKGSGSVGLFVTHSSGPTANVVITLTASWVRYQIALPSAVANGTLTFRILNLVNAINTISFWGPQTNIGAAATDYIGSTALAEQLVAQGIYADSPLTFRYSMDLTGSTQISGPAFLSNIDFKTKVNGIVTFTASLQATATQTVTTI